MKGTVYVNNGYWWYAVRLPGEKKRKARKLCAPRSEIALHADRTRDVAMAAALLGHHQAFVTTQGYSREAAVDELLRIGSAAIEELG